MIVRGSSLEARTTFVLLPLLVVVHIFDTATNELSLLWHAYRIWRHCRCTHCLSSGQNSRSLPTSHRLSWTSTYYYHHIQQQQLLLLFHKRTKKEEKETCRAISISSSITQTRALVILLIIISTSS